MSKNQTIATIFAVICSAGMLFAQSAERTGSLSGTVLDRATQQPVIGATVTVVGTKIGGVTRATGEFRIGGIAPGTYRVRVSSIGFEPRTMTDVSVRSEHATTINIELMSKDVQLEGAVVTAPIFEKNSDNITSSSNFSYEEVRRLPGSMEDLGRVAQSMPGVAVTDDGRNDLVVRGGAPTENLNIIDGIEIPNINHFGTQGAGGGPISMINTNFIEEVNLSSGGFGAEFGDKLSSVMTVRMREGNRAGFQGNVDLNTAGIGVLMEGPMTSSGSYLFSVNRSYLNLIHNIIGITAVPNYQDVSAKLVYDVSPAHKLTFLLIGGLDDVHFATDAQDSVGLQFKNTLLNQSQATAGLSWRWLWGTAGYSDVSVFSNIFNYNIDARDKGNTPTFLDASHDREYGVRAKASWRLNSTFNLTGGATAKFITDHDQIFQMRDSIEYLDPFGTFREHYYGGIDQDIRTTAMKLGAFTELAVTTGSFIFTGGVRMDHFSFLNGTNTVFGPRLSASWLWSPVTSLNASFGEFYQAPEMVWMTTVPSNRDLSYIHAQHFILGFEHQFDEDLKLTIEGYDKEYTNYPVSLDNPYFVFVSSGAEYGASVPGPAHSSGTGFVRGVDVSAQKKLMGNFYGLLSYSYTYGRFQGDAGGLRPGAFDYPHIFTVIAGYTIGTAWEFSIKWRYTEGRPTTPYDSTESTKLNEGVLIFDRYNLDRQSAYHRMDVRGDYRASFSWGNLVAYVELQNVYARNNVLQSYWNTNKDVQGRIYQWGFLPVGGVKVEF